MALVSYIPLSEADWCAPAIRVYNGCVASDLGGYHLHNWLIAWVNFFAALVLLLALCFRVFLAKQRKVTVYFITASMCIFADICTRAGTV